MKNPAIAIISSVVSIILLIVEVIFLVQFNISRGIKQNTILEIIDNTNIQDEIEETDEYKEIKQINPIVSKKIIQSDEFEKYVKENMKAMYINIFYDEKIEYVKSDELKEFIENTIQSEEIAEEEKGQLLDKTDSIIYEIDNSIDEVENANVGTGILKAIFSKTTNYILLTGVILLAMILVGINKLKESLIWIGIPTIMSGGLFLLLSLELKQAPNIETLYKPLLNELTETISKSGIITMTIGLAIIAFYAIKKSQKESEFNGKI